MDDFMMELELLNMLEADRQEKAKAKKEAEQEVEKGSQSPYKDVFQEVMGSYLSLHSEMDELWQIFEEEQQMLEAKAALEEEQGE